MPYYIRHQGRKQGPLSEAQLTTLLSRGTISPNTEASLDEVHWQPLGAFPELKHLFAAPPPLPTQATNNDIYGTNSHSVTTASTPPNPFTAEINWSQTADSVAMTPPPPHAAAPGVAKVNLKILYGVAAVVLVVVLIVVGVAKSKQAERARQLAEQAERDRQAAEEAERMAAEAEAAAEAERERRIAEQTERDRQAAAEAERAAMAAKAAAEQAERDRKAAEEAERAAQRAKEAEEEKIKKALGALPTFWADIALPSRNVGGPVVLEGSEFLWDHKELVTISIVPFVDLSTTPELEIVSSAEIHSIAFAVENRGNEEEDEDEDEEEDEAETEETESAAAAIITFALQKGGVSYEWNTESLRNYNDRDSHRRLNRIFLSKLRIEIAGIESKEVALWTPVEYTADEFKTAYEIGAARTRFTPWQPDGKEFITVPEDDASMFLDFDELFHNRTSHQVAMPKTFDFSPLSLAYTPGIPRINGSQGICVVEPDESREGRANLRVFINFYSEEVAQLAEPLKMINAQIKRLDAQIGPLNRRLSQAITARRDLERVNKRLNQKAVHHENRGPQYNPAEARKLRGIVAQNVLQMRTIQNGINGLNAQIDNLRRQKAPHVDREREIKAATRREEDKWRTTRIDLFALDLLKPGAPSSEIAQPENRLPLFRVVP